MGVFAQLIRAPPSWDHLYARERSVPSKRVILTQSTIWIAEISMHPGSNLNSSNQLKGDSWRWTSCGLETTTQDLVALLKRSKALIMVHVPLVANNFIIRLKRGFPPHLPIFFLNACTRKTGWRKLKVNACFTDCRIRSTALKAEQKTHAFTILKVLNIILNPVWWNRYWFSHWWSIRRWYRPYAGFWIRLK